MNVSLTPELEALVQEKVKSGMYNSASEVVRDGLRLIQERDNSRRLGLEELRRQVQIGIDQLDRGEGIVYETPEDVLAAMDERLEERRRQRAASKAQA